MLLHDRIDYLGQQAEECLEDIPTDIEQDELQANPHWTNQLQLYEQCVGYIEAIQAELNYGKDIIDYDNI